MPLLIAQKQFDVLVGKTVERVEVTVIEEQAILWFTDNSRLVVSIHHRRISELELIDFVYIPADSNLNEE